MIISLVLYRLDARRGRADAEEAARRFVWGGLDSGAKHWTSNSSHPTAEKAGDVCKLRDKTNP
jgi:hypothetical protein